MVDMATCGVHVDAHDMTVWAAMTMMTMMMNYSTNEQMPSPMEV
jgi:hypothetical protein